MKRSLRFVVVLVLLSRGTAVRAQDAPTIVDVQVGFQPLPTDARTPTHKIGLWTPISVTLQAPANANRESNVTLVAAAEDSEDSLALTRLAVSLRAGESKIVTTYAKPGRSRGDILVWLETDNGTAIASRTLTPTSADLGHYLYLSLGARLDDLSAALTFRETKAAEDGRPAAKPIRFAVAETDPKRVPDRWQGYDGIDLVILNSGDGAFVDQLTRTDRVRPLLDWTARGGRLVIPIAPERAEKISRLFVGDTAQPISTQFAKTLVPIEAWSGLQNKPFPRRGEPPIPVARLEPKQFAAEGWDVLAQLDGSATGDKTTPLIVRIPYGLGSITLIAFALDDGAFAKWDGQVEFFRVLVDQIGPRYVAPEKTKDALWGTDAGISDWGAQLQRELDNFDVPSYSFATVAILILLFLLLVSAVEYFVLRRFVRRLEATWVTLPLLVAGVSAAAYFALDPAGDHTLRVNQIDLIDISLLRSADGAPAKTHTTTFVTVRGDIIRTLDIGVSDGLGDPAALAWFGRPDDGPAGIGRAGGQSLSGKSYSFDDKLRGIRDLTFPFRATKSFQADRLAMPQAVRAASEGTPTSGTFEASLTFHPRDSLFKISGTLKSDLPFDLVEAHLFAFDRVYPIAGGLKKGESRRIEIREIDNGLLPSDWRDLPEPNRPTSPRGVYDPGKALKNILFHERLDPTMKIRNHLLRRLDWSWRLRDDPRVLNVPLSSLGTREAIVVGRAKFQQGDAKTIAASTGVASVSLESTGGEPAWPGANGQLARDVFVRAVVPLRPQP